MKEKPRMNPEETPRKDELTCMICTLIGEKLCELQQVQEKQPNTSSRKPTRKRNKKHNT